MDAAFAITLSTTLGLSLLAFTGIWLIHVFTQDAGIVDYYWGPGFAVIGIVYAAIIGISGLAQWLFLLAVIVWAVRLGGHLVVRHRGSHVEEARYAAMRTAGGPGWWWASLFKVFLLQGALQWMIAAPVHVALSPASTGTGAGFAFWAGMAIFAVGFAIEWIADNQLASAKRDLSAQGEAPVLYEGGLWGVVRHPNYLGEIMLWWGLALAAAALSGNAIAFAGPVLLTLAIVGVSVPLTEQHMRRSRPGYNDYVRRIPAVLPRLRATVVAGPRAGEPTGQN